MYNFALFYLSARLVYFVAADVQTTSSACWTYVELDAKSTAGLLSRWHLSHYRDIDAA